MHPKPGIRWIEHQWPSVGDSEEDYDTREKCFNKEVDSDDDSVEVWLDGEGWSDDESLLDDEA